MTKKLLLKCFTVAAFAFTACNNNGEKAPGVGLGAAATTGTESAQDKGIGKFKELKLTNPLNASMVEAGEGLYNSKCIACHKLTDEKLVGPGWQGLTAKRRPEWILNFVTNTSTMLDSDLVAQQLLVTCVARMPNQNLSDEDARSILEFMRKNDGQQ